jgi:hypothetical protein
MTALAAVRRKRTALMVVANLLALVAVGGLGYAGQAALRDYKGATLVGVDSIKLPTTPVGLLATVDEADVLTSITVFVLRAGTQLGGSIVSVPVTGDARDLGDVRRPLRELYQEGGLELLAQGVESALSIGFDFSTVATPAQAEALLAPVTPVAATFASDVVGAAADGTSLTLFNAGVNNLSAAQTVQVLNAREPGRRDADRRPNITAVWSAVATAIGAGRTTAANGGAPQPLASFQELIERLYAGPVEARGLSTEPVRAVDNPDRKDVESIVRSEAIFILASVAPGSMTAPSPDLTYRIEAPPGYEDRVQFAVWILLFLGANVVSVYLGGDEHPEPRMCIADANLADKTDNTYGAFGTPVILTPERPTEGVDVVLQLGTDFLKGEGTELPAVTTSTTEPT